ncbi:MAG: hypothetical protein GY822_05815 [Deltaproteobacteria bacterium]|nr:hypothetical protein [Deltaproteobacteria bacterium]
MISEMKAHPFIVLYLVASVFTGMGLGWGLLPEDFSLLRRILSGGLGGFILACIPVLNHFMGALDGDDTWDGDKRAAHRKEVESSSEDL